MTDAAARHAFVDINKAKRMNLHVWLFHCGGLCIAAALLVYCSAAAYFV
jgi:hypothetical protein